MGMTMNRKSSGVFLVLGSVLSYSLLTFLLGHIQNGTTLSAESILFFRFAFAGGLVFILTILKGQSFKSKEWRKSSVVGLFYFLTSYFFFEDILNYGAVKATAVLFSYPIFLFLIFLIAEKVFSVISLFAAIMATIGCWLTLEGYLSLNEKLIFPFSSLFYAIYIWLAAYLKIGEKLRDSGQIFFIASLAFLMIGLNSNLEYFLPSLNAKILLLVFLASILTVGSVSLFLKGTSILGGMKTGVIASFEPAVTLILAVIFFTEKVTLTQVLGVALVLVANMLINVRKKRTTLLN